MLEAIRGLNSNYNVKIIDDKTDYVRADHKNAEIIVSPDVKFDRNSNGELNITFINEQKKPTFGDMIKDLCGTRYEAKKPDCSITIHNPSTFQYCERKNGEYHLFAQDVTFNGTDHADTLYMYEPQNVKVNMGDGDDKVKLMGGNEANRFYPDCNNNSVNMGKGDDSVEVSGNFNSFKDNKFYLGKGDDTFSAKINSEDDTNIITSQQYDNTKHKLSKNVYNSIVHATDGKRGYFEKDTFTSKTFSANQLLVSQFKEENLTIKPEPIRTTKPIEQPKAPEVAPQNEDKPVELELSETEKRKLRYSVNSLLYYADPKYFDGAFNALQDEVNSWANPKQ